MRCISTLAIAISFALAGGIGCEAPANDMNNGNGGGAPPPPNQVPPGPTPPGSSQPDGQQGGTAIGGDEDSDVGNGIAPGGIDANDSGAEETNPSPDLPLPEPSVNQ